MTDEQREIYISLLLLALDDERLRGNWIAMDSGGEFYTFDEEPHISRINKKVWVQGESAEYVKKASEKFNHFINRSFGEMWGNLPWEDSLIKIN